MPFVETKDLLKKVNKTYSMIDAHMKKAMDDLKATCVKGCAGCCHMLVSTTFIEALNIVSHLYDTMSAEQLVDLKAKLEKKSDEYRKMVSRDDIEGRPCTFLEPSDKKYMGLCSVYDVRPIACRTYFVISDPALCMPDSPNDTVKMFDSYKVNMLATQEITFGSEELASFGPLEPMVLIAMNANDNNPPNKEELKYWRRKHMELLGQDPDLMELLGVHQALLKGGNI